MNFNNIKIVRGALYLVALLLTSCNAGDLTIATKAWGTAALIETSDFGNAYVPQIAFDASGNALAVWYQFDATFNRIFVNRYTASTDTWGTAVAIDNNTGDALDPQIAIDPNGNALAVWNQFDGTRNNIWARRYASGTWGLSAQLIETDNIGTAFGQQIAIDPNGNALAVWEQYDGTRNNIWANRYNVSSGLWGFAQLIEIDNLGSADASQVAVDASGNAMAVWQQSDGTRLNILANSYTAGTDSWGTAALIENDNFGPASHPQVAFDSSGNAMAVWQQNTIVGTNILANRYIAGTGWGTASYVETGNTGLADYPQIAFDTSGNALAVWYKNDGMRYNIWANRYTAATGTWGTAELIETDNTGNADSPQIAIDANGNALAVWEQQSNGTRYDIWANRYQ